MINAQSHRTWRSSHEGEADNALKIVYRDSQSYLILNLYGKTLSIFLQVSIGSEYIQCIEQVTHKPEVYRGLDIITILDAL